MEMENFSHPLVLAFVITWIIEFFLFGMQRASLLISRSNNVQWKGFGQYLLPSWYPVTWLFRIGKYGLFIAIFFIIGWKLAFGLLIITFVLSSILPIPYRLLYKNTFRSKVEKLKAIDPETGEFYSEMLNKTDF